MGKSDFLIYLKDELNQYSCIPDNNPQAKSEKKQFINGLMRGSRFFGVSFDELKEVTDNGVKTQVNEHATFKKEDLLNIPEFIREYRDKTL